MALENKTISEINEAIINQIEAQISQTIPILPISFTRILAKILAGVFLILYKVAQKLFLDIFVSTASFKETTIFGKKVTPLIEWGVVVGAGQPQTAIQTELKIEVTVNDIGETLPSGTQFISTLNGLIYITQTDYILTAGPDAIDVICTTGGSDGNLEVGQTLTLINTLGIIDNDADITDILITGVDAESEASYRQRVVERFQLQPQGGALADYRLWASEVEGVLQTYIYTGDPGNVLIYVAGDIDLYSDRIPDSALLLLIGAACTYDPITGKATRKQVTAIIDPDGDETYGNVLPITVKLFDVIIFDLDVEDEADVMDQIEEALEAFFLEKEPYILGLSVLPRRDIVSRVNVIGIIDDIVNANNGSFSDALIYEKDTYMAVAHDTSPYITIYKRSGDVFTKLADPADLPAGAGRGFSFSANGVYMAVAHYTSPYITIYKRSGDTFTKLADPASLPTGNGQLCAFSSDDTYLAVSYTTSPYITIYKRSGDTFTKLADPASLPASTGYACAFSSDDTYLAVAHPTSPYITIYKRSGDTFTKLADPASLPTGNGYACAFSSDGTYLAVGHSTSPYITIYKRSGDTFTKLADPASLPTGIVRGCIFSSDDTYLAVSHIGSPYITIYKRSGDTFTKLADPASLPAGNGQLCAFSSDNIYFAVAHSYSPYITIYKRSVDTFTKLADPASLPTGDGYGVMFSTGGLINFHTLEEGQLAQLDLLDFQDS